MSLDLSLYFPLYTLFSSSLWYSPPLSSLSLSLLFPFLSPALLSHFFHLTIVAIFNPNSQNTCWDLLQYSQKVHGCSLQFCLWFELLPQLKVNSNNRTSIYFIRLSIMVNDCSKRLKLHTGINLNFLMTIVLHILHI